MHGRRSLKHNLLTELKETQEIQLQLAEDRKETNSDNTGNHGRRGKR